MLYLDGERFVLVQDCQLDIGRVGHIKATQELGWANAGTRSNPHDTIECYLFRHGVSQVINESGAVRFRLK